MGQRAVIVIGLNVSISNSREDIDKTIEENLMIGKIFKIIVKNFQTFLITWVVILIANQLFIFGACFAPYCLIAGLPHTGVIAALVTYFMNEASEGNNTLIEKTQESHTQYKAIEDDDINNDFEKAQEPFCPKCGSKMVLRTAKKGRYAGKNFWGCSRYPDCNGILKI